MFVFGQSGCITAEVGLVSQRLLYLDKVVVFVQKWLYSVKVAVFRQEVVVFRQCGCIRAKVAVFLQCGFIRSKWLNSGKKCYIGQNDCIRVKLVVLGQKWLYSGKVVVFRQM